METKELIINGTLFAKYKIEGDTIFMKIIKNIIYNDPEKSEDVLIYIICLYENKKFKTVSYLNI